MKGQHKVIIQTIIFIVFSLCTLATVNALFDPGLPTNPDPSDDAITVPVDQDLSWTNGADTETIDLYFADDEWLVTDKDLSVLVLDNIFVDTYDPGILDLGTEYYWRVVSHNSSKATTDGPVWSFTTTDQYMLIVTKGIDTHINDVELSWLPGNLISVFYKQSPNVVVGYQLLDQDVTPSSWHPAALIDGIDYYYMVSNDEAPIIDLITDVDVCAQSGVSIEFTRSSAATQHDLWVDGAEVLTAVSSPCWYDPGDGLAHDYVIRGIFGSFNLDSNLMIASDADNNPEAPTLNSVIDLDACGLTGVSITFTGGSGATSYDLWIDGAEVATGISNPYTYAPIDSNSHDFVVRALNGNCYADSNIVAGTDLDNTPVPTITGAVENTCPDETVTLSTETGMSSYQWYQDASPLSGQTTESLLVTTTGGYTVFYENAFGCSGLSASHTVTITDCGSCTSGELFSTDAIVGNMRSVCAGVFTQGSPSDEPCRSSNETQFNHTLTRNIAVMETEVTRQMWADLKAARPNLPADPSFTPYAPTMSHPVNQPTWYETVLFANLLSLQNGLTRCYYKDASFTDPVTISNYMSGTFYCNFAASGYRLLSEGEWEHAARAGTTTPFSCNETNYTSGNCTICTPGTHPTLEQHEAYCANSIVQSYAAGSFLSNPWNLKDMHGNLREWCWDWYNSTYPGDTTDYSGPGSGSNRVIRGGYWNLDALGCRSAYRYYGTPSIRDVIMGFRLARSVN